MTNRMHINLRTVLAAYAVSSSVRDMPVPLGFNIPYQEIRSHYISCTTAGVLG